MNNMQQDIEREIEELKSAIYRIPNKIGAFCVQFDEDEPQ